VTYDFSLDRKATFAVSAGSILLLILVFVAGILTGLTWRSSSTAEPVAAKKPAAPAEKTVAVNAAPPAAVAPTAAPRAAAPAAAAASTPAVPAQAPDTSGVQLVVQVGAFLEKENADKLVERLKEEGYSPQVVLAGQAPRQWSFVRVGPYHDWEEASEIAAVLSRDQTAPAVVRPLR
jgi:cell division septation protein DedD